MLALATMDPTIQGILFLIAVVLAVIASFGVYRPQPWGPALFPLAFAFFAFVFMWNAFAAS